MSETTYLRGGIWVGMAIGFGAVAAALITGLVIAWLLSMLGLTDTGVWPLGPWLAGLGLLGGWEESLSTGTRTTWVAGAPLLVTAEAAVMVAGLARLTRLSLAGTLLAVAAAGLSSALLVAASTEADEAVTQGLTWWWSGGLRPGTVTGAMLLVGTVGLVHTLGQRWWDAGRPVAMSLLVVPGVAITALLAVGLAVRSGSLADGAGLLLLTPLLGTTVLLAAGGSPAEVSHAAASQDTYELVIWTAGPGWVVAGLFAAVGVAVVAGSWLRFRRITVRMRAGVGVTAALALAMTWAMGTSGDLGATDGIDLLAVNPLAAAAVAAVLALVAILVRGGQPAAAPEGPDPSLL